MKKLILILLIILFPVMGQAGNYYACLADAGEHDGSSWENCKALSGVSWSTLAGAENTVWVDGGASGVSYAPLIFQHNSTNQLYIKPGSASPVPTGHDGMVTFQGGVGEVYGVIQVGDNSGATGLAKYVTIDGSKTSTDHTINMRITGGSNHGICHRQDSANVANIQYLYLEIDNNASHGISLQPTNTGPFLVQGCYIHDNHGDGLNGSVGNSTYGTFVVDSSHFKDNWDDAIQIAGSIDISNNILDTTNANPLSNPAYHPDAYQGSQGYVRVWNNKILGSTQGIFIEALGSFSNLRIYNNVFKGLLNPAIHPKLKANSGAYTLSDVVIANNTMINTDLTAAIIGVRWLVSCVNAGCDGATLAITDTKFTNNIVYNFKTNLSWEGTIDASAVTMNNNDWYGNTSVTWNGNTYANAAALNAVQAGNINTEPLFMDTTDYKPAYNSPVLKAGDSTVCAATVTTDKDGLANNDGHCPIGAYNFRGAVWTVAP